MHTVVSVTLVLGYVAVLTFVAVRARAARDYAEFSIARRVANSGARLPAPPRPRGPSSE